jgi:hypothetical protein
MRRGNGPKAECLAGLVSRSSPGPRSRVRLCGKHFKAAHSPSRASSSSAGVIADRLARERVRSRVGLVRTGQPALSRPPGSAASEVAERMA